MRYDILSNSSKKALASIAVLILLLFAFIMIQMYSEKKEATKEQAIFEAANKPAPVYVKPSEAPTTTRPQKAAESFTVREYNIYRQVITTSYDCTEDQAFRMAGKKYGCTPAEAKAITNKVMKIISDNGWMGKPENEIKHASDYHNMN